MSKKRDQDTEEMLFLMTEIQPHSGYLQRDPSYPAYFKAVLQRKELDTLRQTGRLKRKAMTFQSSEVVCRSVEANDILAAAQQTFQDMNTIATFFQEHPEHRHNIGLRQDFLQHVRTTIARLQALETSLSDGTCHFPETMTITEAAKYLRTSEQDISDLIQKGHIPYRRNHEVFVFLRQELDAWMTAQPGSLDGGLKHQHAFLFERSILHSQSPNPTIDDINEDIDAQSGFVYIARSGPYHKIGKANDVQKRLYDLSAAMAEPLELIYSIPSSEPIQLERQLQHRFADKCVGRELFDLTADDLTWLARLVENGVYCETITRANPNHH